MNYSHKRPFTKNSDARTASNVRLGIPAFAVDEHGPPKTARTPRGLHENLGDEIDKQSARPPTGAIARFLEKGTTQRGRTFDDAIDTLPLLTVSDVCRL